MNAEICTECGRALLLSNGMLMCCWRHCPVYGRDQSPDEAPNNDSVHRERER